MSSNGTYDKPIRKGLLCRASGGGNTMLTDCVFEVVLKGLKELLDLKGYLIQKA